MLVLLFVSLKLEFSVINVLISMYSTANLLRENPAGGRGIMTSRNGITSQARASPPFFRFLAVLI
jgi:hypothetical protein